MIPWSNSLPRPNRMDLGSALGLVRLQTPLFPKHPLPLDICARLCCCWDLPPLFQRDLASAMLGWREELEQSMGKIQENSLCSLSSQLPSLFHFHHGTAPQKPQTRGWHWGDAGDGNVPKIWKKAGAGWWQQGKADGESWMCQCWAVERGFVFWLGWVKDGEASQGMSDWGSCLMLRIEI